MQPYEYNILYAVIAKLNSLPMFHMCMHSSHSISSAVILHILFAQLRKAVLGSSILNSVPHALCAQEFATLPYLTW